MPVPSLAVRSITGMLRALRRGGAVALLTALGGSSSHAQAPGRGHSTTAAHIRSAPSAGDSISAVRTVDAFRAAMANGDSAAVLALLAPDALVVESGDVETFDDYHHHHLAEDIAFARAVHGAHILQSAHVEGNTAWLVSTSITQGQFQGRAINSAGAELVVLTRLGAGVPWRIRAIHWSSHRRTS